MTTAIRGPVQTTVTWNLESAPLTTMRLELYWSNSCDTTGFGEGLLYLGSTTATTDASGLAAGTMGQCATAGGDRAHGDATPVVAGVAT